MLPASYLPGQGRGKNTLAVRSFVMFCYHLRTRARTVKSLGCIGDVGDTEVACKDDKEWDEVRPRAGSGVREKYLKERKASVHRMLGDIGPS